MLSRINQFAKCNAIIRQISTNLTLSKQYQVRTEPSQERTEDKKAIQRSKNQFKNFDSKSMKNIDFKIKNLHENKPNAAKTEPIDNLTNIIDQFKQNQNSFKNLVQPCQQMNELFEQDPKLTESFNTDPLKSLIVNQMVLNLDKMNINEFFTASQFILRFDLNKFDRVQPFLTTNMANMSLDQLFKTLLLLRTPQLYKMQVLDTVRSFTNFIRSRLEEIENYNQLKRALKIFCAEPNIVKSLDQKLLKLADDLKASDWVDLLNTKSIYRQNDQRAILDLCSYNLMKLKKIDVESIQKCLLSCGILFYHDQQFYKFLLESLHNEIKHNDSKDWLEKNEKNFQSILSSIGILQLRDDKLLASIQYMLEKNSGMQNLIVNFVTSCGVLNYRAKNLEKLKSKISIKNFDLTNRKGKVSLVNYVWSLCSLDSPDSNLISHVLAEQFWKDVLSDKPEEKQISKVALLKLLNINLYSILCMESYQGNNLPEDFSISDYPEFFVETPPNETFISTLSSFRSIDKYYKLNMLTPFGIFIEALMVVDKNGVPCQLAKFLNENLSLETSGNEFKVAFKLIGPRDLTLLNKNLNGILTFQLKLLKELGYHPIIINHEELKSASLINRVNIIQNKLKDLVKNK